MSAGRRVGFWDLVLYATAMNFGVRWLATGAAAGPAALPLWLLAALVFLTPLVIASLELSARYDDEGGVYAWTRRNFGPFAGFLCGWLYWTCNLPYFSSVLYFIVGLLARALGGEAGAAVGSPWGVVLVGSGLALLVALLNAMGLGVGKRLPALSAATSALLLLGLVGAALWLAAKRGSATDFAGASYLPPLTLDGAILWSTFVFAYGGAEGVALLRNEVRGGAGVMARALGLVGAALALAYLLGTAALLAILPVEEASRLAGLPEALARGLEELGQGRLAPLALGALALILLGGYSAWFGAAARLPYAAGLAGMLPAALARQDARTGAPVLAILIQTACVIALLALSQAGATLESGYDFLVAMSVISYALPFLFLFAAYWRAQREPAPAGTWSLTGGGGRARLVALAGFLVSLSAVLCSLAPSPSAPDAGAATLKVVLASLVLIGAGMVVYVLARQQGARAG